MKKKERLPPVLLYVCLIYAVISHQGGGEAGWLCVIKRPCSPSSVSWDGEQEQGSLAAALSQPSHSISNLPKSSGTGFCPVGASFSYFWAITPQSTVTEANSITSILDQQRVLEVSNPRGAMTRHAEANQPLAHGRKQYGRWQAQSQPMACLGFWHAKL